MDKLVAKYGAGASVSPFQNDLTKDCAEKNDPRYPFGKCAPLMPDLLLLRVTSPQQNLGRNHPAIQVFAG